MVIAPVVSLDWKVVWVFAGLLMAKCLYLANHGKQERDGDAGEGRRLSPSPAPSISVNLFLVPVGRPLSAEARSDSRA